MRKAPEGAVHTLIPLDKRLKKQVKLLVLEKDLTFAGWVNEALQRQLVAETMQHQEQVTVG